jgi:hypothetical protein
MLLSPLLALVAANPNVCGPKCEPRLIAMGHTAKGTVCSSDCKTYLEAWKRFLVIKKNEAVRACTVQTSEHAKMKRNPQDGRQREIYMKALTICHDLSDQYWNLKTFY